MSEIFKFFYEIFGFLVLAFIWFKYDEWKVEKKIKEEKIKEDKELEIIQKQIVKQQKKKEELKKRMEEERIKQKLEGKKRFEIPISNQISIRNLRWQRRDNRRKKDPYFTNSQGYYVGSDWINVSR